MMTPEQGLQMLEDRNKVLAEALRDCLDEMQRRELGHSSAEHWAMAMETAARVLKESVVIY